MAGTWTDITRIDVPSSAEEGDTVDVSVGVKNIYSYAIYIPVTAEADGISMYFSPASPIVNPGETKSYSSSFIMPNKDVLLTVKSWISNYTMELDDTETERIELVGVPPGWVQVATRSIAVRKTVEVVEWVQVAAKTIAVRKIIAIIGWVQVASRTIAIGKIAAVVGWVQVAEKAITVSVSGVVPPCTPGETKCIGPDLYQCSSEEEWVLVEKDSPVCVVEEKFPWLLLAVGGGVAAVAIAAAAKKKKPVKEKRA